MDDIELKNICRDVLEGYPDKVNNYKLGKTGLLGLFAGEVMKRSKGKAEPKKVNKFLIELINEM